MGQVYRWMGRLHPGLMVRRSIRKTAEVGKEDLPLGPVFVEHETWFGARAESCRLLLAGLTEVEVLKQETESK